MAITQDKASLVDSIDDPQIIAAFALALQNFISSCAREGMKLPLSVTIADSDGDIVREFVLEKSGRKTLGHTSNFYSHFTAPFTFVAIDAESHVAVMKFVARSVENAVIPEQSETQIVH
jgi:hypothetical protein